MRNLRTKILDAVGEIGQPSAVLKLFCGPVSQAQMSEFDSSGFAGTRHVLSVRKRLWEPGVTGRAAVMVGAGFSLNADPHSSNVSSFPLWRQLAEKLYDGLYPRPNTEERERVIRLAAANGGMLRLAHEYEASFGRHALDDLLLNAIPDKQHEPGELHHLLLTLPWADVFTTNYDTLLERARPYVYERDYRTVLTHSDLPTAKRPRIIKLHGSLPSHRPFVFTEEDYRKYPKRAAPFVNTVRQSLMENAFLLIGFSGDDPNFLAWLGWVRDELDTAAPSVYLCGVLDLSPAQRNVLQSRGVTPIDLGSLFPSEMPSVERNEKAVRWLLLSLLNGRPLSGLHWPDDAPDDDFNPDPRFPPLSSPPSPGSQPSTPKTKSLSNQDDFNAKEHLLQTVEEWVKTRELYPGWIWTPRRNRDKFWRNTKQWSETIHENVQALEPENRLRVLGEFVWRMERASVIFQKPLDEALRKTLSEHAPSDLAGSLREHWIRIALFLLRDARRSGNEAAFEAAMERVAPLAEKETRVDAARCYEGALRCLGLLDAPQANEWAERWPEATDPLWQIRRAGVLLELGRRDEAEDLLADILTRLRSTPSSSEAPRYAQESREALAMHLLSIIDWSRRPLESLAADNRMDELRALRCDIGVELDHLRPRLQAQAPSLKPAKQNKIDSLGRKRVSYSIGGGGIDLRQYRPAYEYLDLKDEGGLPIWYRSNTSYSNTVRVVEWIIDLSPAFTIKTLLRTLKHKELGDHLDRLRVGGLESDFVEELASAGVDTLERSFEALRSTPRSTFSEGSFRSLEEFQTSATLLLKLAFRLAEPVREKALRLVLAILEDPPQATRELDLKYLRRLASEVFGAMQPDEVAEELDRLLQLPLPESGIDPVLELNLEDIDALPGDAERTAVPYLLRVLREGDPPERMGALRRLERLYREQLLKAKTAHLFAQALWSRTDPETGLPEDTGFHNWAFLTLPEPEEGRAKEALHQLLKENSLARCSAKGRVEHGETATVPFGGRTREVEKQLSDWQSSAPPRQPDEVPEYPRQYIEWTVEEARNLVGQLIECGTMST